MKEISSSVPVPGHIARSEYQKSPFVGIVGGLHIPLLRIVVLTPLFRFPLKEHFGRHNKESRTLSHISGCATVGNGRAPAKAPSATKGLFAYYGFYRWGPDRAFFEHSWAPSATTYYSR